MGPQRGLNLSGPYWVLKTGRGAKFGKEGKAKAAPRMQKKPREAGLKQGPGGKMVKKQSPRQEGKRKHWRSPLLGFRNQGSKEKPKKSSEFPNTQGKSFLKERANLTSGLNSKGREKGPASHRATEPAVRTSSNNTQCRKSAVWTFFLRTIKGGRKRNQEKFFVVDLPKLCEEGGN